MKYVFTILCLIGCLAEGALAQEDAYIINQQGSITIMPYYQRWSVRDNFDFSEFSTSVSLYVPAGREWSLLLRGLPASVNGDVTRLSAFTDTQLGLSYHVENPDIVFTLGVNLPTGKKELTQDEFGTSIILSNSVFNLQVPNFGQGLNISPGLVYATPLSDDLVLGLGISYQYKGSYKTLANYDDYNPGDEVVVTGGFDVRLEEATNLSADIVVTTYGTDKLGSDDVLSPSTKIAVNAQLLKGLGSDMLTLFGQFLLKGTSKFTVGNLMIDEVDKIEPNRFDLQGRYAARLSERFIMALIVEGRLYESTEVNFAGKNMFGVGFDSDILLSKSLTLPVKMKYQTGALKDGTTLSSVSGGVGLMVKF